MALLRRWPPASIALLVSLGLAHLLASQAPVNEAMSPGDGSLEYRVKAAYLLNFTRYVEWPPSALGAAPTPLTICVLGRDPFGAVLDATVRGRTTQGRSVGVRRIRNEAESAGCHVVYVGRDAWREQKDLPRAISHQGILTVGESEEFAREGGVIGFVIQEETVRFVVNAEARDRAGLKISSRMLSLAAAVYGQRSRL
jgi:YfiR/HmsC-like